jgi:hypothetical protein
VSGGGEEQVLSISHGNGEQESFLGGGSDTQGLQRLSVFRTFPLPSYTLRAQDWHIIKALELMDESCGGLLLVLSSHRIEAIIDSRLELLE